MRRNRGGRRDREIERWRAKENRCTKPLDSFSSVTMKRYKKLICPFLILLTLDSLGEARSVINPEQTRIKLHAEAKCEYIMHQ